MKNKSIINCLFMVCTIILFLVANDKVEAKATSCTYEYLDGTISFSVNQNDELVLKSNVFTECADMDMDGVAETCIDSTIQSLKLSRYDLSNLILHTAGNRGTVNSEEFLAVMKNNFGWEKEQVLAVYDNGCSNNDCEVKIKLDSDGYCPKIYVAENVTGSISTVMPESIDCNGSGAFGWISNGLDDLFACNGVSTGGYEAVENQQCSSEQLNQAISSLVKEETNKIQSSYENLSGSLNSDTFDPSQAPDQNNIEQYCNQPIVAVNNFVTEVNKYTEGSSAQNLINGILADLKSQYQNCRLSLTDQEIKNTAISQFNSYISTLSSDVSSLLSRAESKAIECIEKAENMTQDEKDDAVDKIEQNTEDSRDSVLSSLESFKDKISSITFGDQATISCEGLLGDRLLNKIDEIFGYVKIAAPIILILLGSIDFGQVVLTEGTDNKDALKKATSRFVKRAIVCVAIFFVPTILSYILHFIDGVGVDPMCGIK